MSFLNILPDSEDIGLIADQDRKFRLIKSYLPGFIQRGANQTQTRQAFRAAGFRFGDQPFNRLFNEVKALETRFNPLRATEGTSWVTQDMLVTSSRPLTNQMRFVAQFDVADDSLSRSLRGTFSIDISQEFFGSPEGDDIIATAEEIENAIIQAIAEKYEISPDIVSEIRLMYGFVNE